MNNTFGVLHSRLLLAAGLLALGFCHLDAAPGGATAGGLDATSGDNGNALTGLCGAGTGITPFTAGSTASGGYAGDYNRSYGFGWNVTASGKAEVFSRLGVRATVSLGQTGAFFDIEAAVRADYRLPFERLPLSVSAVYFVYGMPVWNYAVHSVLPLVSLDWKRGGFALGPLFHFLDIDGMTGVYTEFNIAFSWYVRLYSGKTFALNLRSSNYTESAAASIGDMFLGFEGTVNVRRHWTLFFNADVKMTGMYAAAATFWGVSFGAGILYRRYP
jgi:hypothetical protein